MEWKKKNYSKRIRPLTVILLVVILITSVISGTWLYDIFGKDVTMAKDSEELTEEQLALQKEREQQKEQQKSKEKSSDIMYLPLEESKDEIVITGESDVIDALEELQPYLGILDAHQEYQCKLTDSTDQFDVYTLQQYYKGIEVYGYTIKIAADPSGHIEFINGAYQPIENFDTSTKLYESDAKKKVEKYLKETYQISNDEVEIDSYDKIIYFSEKEEPMIGYFFQIKNGYIVTREILVDGNSGEIVSDYSSLQTDMLYNYNVQGQAVTQTMDVFQQSDTEYVLKDTERNMKCFTYEDLEHEITWNPAIESPAPSAVDALANLQRVHDYYYAAYNREGINGNTGELIIVDNYADDSLGLNNAASGTTSNGNLIVITPKSDSRDYTCSEDLDIMAHEYTHGIVGAIAQLGKYLPDGSGQKSIPYTINEGYADIFGELVEDWSDDKQYNNTCNWMHGNDDSGRSLSEPKSPLIIDAKKFKQGTTDCHYGSTIISYPAYLMAHGIENTEKKKINTKTLGSLWYHSLYRLHPSSNFENLRYCIETQAWLMNSNEELSNEQFECVLDAFDRVGINPDYVQYRVAPKSTLKVYNFDNKINQNYHITIRNKKETIVSEDVHKKSYQLDAKVVPGIYTVTITDLENKDSKESFMIMVNDQDSKSKLEKYQTKWNVFTNWGGLPRDVSLVLDISGSMDGIPMQETKKAAIEFIDTVLQENANTRISIITYSDSANVVLESTTSHTELINAIKSINSGGNTNMYEGLNEAGSILKKSKSEKRMIVLMSDGAPNAGKSDLGDHNKPIIKLAKSLKKKDILIYSLGFFHNLNGSELSTCKNLMDSIATEGYHYEVTKADEVKFFFHDLASQVSGDKFVYIRIACPVEVTVKAKGEILSSNEKNLNTRTEFGTLSFDGEENEIKILRLKEESDYEICINGTGKGTMNYSIQFADEEGNYSDVREFKKIPITKKTTIATNTRSDQDTNLKVDNDGDGKFELQYQAGKNKKAQQVNSHFLLYGLLIFGILLLIVLIIKLVIAAKRCKSNRTCPQCGTKVKKKVQFCGKCGTEIHRLPLFLPQKVLRKKQPKAVWITKLVIIGICVLLLAGIKITNQSAANTVYNQIRNQEYESASRLYQDHIKHSTLSKQYFSFVSEHYIEKVQKAYEEKKIDSQNAVTIYQLIADMKIGSASKTAENYLDKLADK